MPSNNPSDGRESDDAPAVPVGVLEGIEDVLDGRTADGAEPATHATNGGETTADVGDDHPGGDDGSDGDRGGPPRRGDASFAEVDDLATRLGVYGVHEGEGYVAGDYGLLYHSDAEAEELAEETGDLRESFDHYDRHVLTTTRASGGQAAVISVWTAKEAAETAAGFLGDLPGIGERLGGTLGEADDAAEGGDDVASADDGIDAAAGASDGDRDAAERVREQLADRGVYAGQPHGEDVYALVLYSTADADELDDAVADAREDFEDREGHVKTAVYDDPDSETTAVVSLWDSTEDAMEFFRSDEFAETVAWGRDVLADRPRHVFLA